MTILNIKCDVTLEPLSMKSGQAFGQNLRKYRKSLGMLQADLAKHFDVSLPTVIRWEAGENLPLSRIDEICEFLGVGYWDMFPKPDSNASPKLVKYKPTLREAVEVVNEHAGEISIGIKRKTI